ncbi:MAG: acyl-CoA thioesterase domain-containing protein [Pseudomonadota bacterium]|nr:acyl-CoA thioesterase domain-containing protein [Pseudomonadota bacterium]
MTELQSPQRNFCFDLHLNSILVTPERCIMTAPLSREIRADDHLSARLGVLATMLDVAGSDPVLAAWSPDWTATQDLSVHRIAPIQRGPIVVDAKTARLGKRVIFVSADLYDGNGITDIPTLQGAIDQPNKAETALTHAARGLITFIRIPRTGASGVDSYDPNLWVGKLKKRSADHHNPELLNERLGIDVIEAEAGIVEITNNPYVANSIGTINGGVQAITVEAAAEAMCPHRIAADLQLHFLSQLKVGPARTECTLVREATDHSVVEVHLVDAGAADRLVARALVTLV